MITACTYSSIVTSSQIPSFNSTFTYLHTILLIVNCWQLNSYCMASNESGCYYRMTTLGSISLNQNVKQPSSHTVHITVGLPFVHQISTSARWNSGSSGVSQYAIKCQLFKRLCSSLEPMHSGHSRSWTQPSGCYIEMACLYRTLNVIIDIMNITSALWIPVSLVHIHTALVPESMNSLYFTVSTMHGCIAANH